MLKQEAETIVPYTNIRNSVNIYLYHFVLLVNCKSVKSDNHTVASDSDPISFSVTMIHCDV